MGKWEACVQECEVLIKETPENEDVGQMIKDAQQQLKKWGICQRHEEHEHHTMTFMVVHNKVIWIVSSLVCSIPIPP